MESVKTALQPCANPNCREQFAPSERKKYCSDRCRAFVHGVKQRIGPHAYLWFVDLERRLRRLER